jgi:hypothetical protein
MLEEGLYLAGRAQVVSSADPHRAQAPGTVRGELGLSRPGVSGDRIGGSTCLGEPGSVSVVNLLDLDRGQVVDGLVRALGVEPVHPVQGLDLDVLAAFPGAVWPDELALVQAHV